MRILLVGEFSRLHNSLKEGLLVLGHEVTIVGSGDDFKQFPVDFSIASKWVGSSKIIKFINKITVKILNINLEGLEKGIRFYRFLPEFKNYDVVQLINSDAIETHPIWEIELYKKLFAQNRKTFLLICGDETPIIEVLLKNKLKYSVLTPYFQNPDTIKNYSYSLKYTTRNYRNLYEFVAKQCDKIMVSDLDYKIPMALTKTDCIFIANPVNIKKILCDEISIDGKIVIFLGINKHSYIKKGSSFFEKALTIIQEKYPEKVEIIIANSLPYAIYEKMNDKAHIVLDQIYGFDQGYNALEAMAKGKVVFTGAETEFIEHYNLIEKVAINALPDVDYLVKELSYLIENPKEIIAIGKRARDFIEKEHDYVKIAEKYVSVWK